MAGISQLAAWANAIVDDDIRQWVNAIRKQGRCRLDHR
jgi:hypothetical protein